MHASLILTLTLLASQDAPDGPEAAARALLAPALESRDLPRWREHVVPSAEERAYEAIPWIPDFAAGLRASEAEGMPLLFWAMNGHPLGCP